MSDRPTENLWKKDLDAWVADGNSLRDFARKIQATDNQVYGWRNGRSRPRRDWQQRFAEGMGRQVDYYLDGSPAVVGATREALPEASAVVLAEVIERLGSAQNALRYLLDGDAAPQAVAPNPARASRRRSQVDR